MNQSETQVSHKHHTGSYKNCTQLHAGQMDETGNYPKKLKIVFVPGCNNMLISILLSRTINIVVGLVKMVVA